MSDSSPTHVWTQVQRLGVHDSVCSYQDYEALCAHGGLLAEKFVAEYHPDIFLPDTSRIIHRMMFRRVHPWAGQLRERGESVIIAGYPAADAWRVGPELDLLHAQVLRWREFSSAWPLTDLQAVFAMSGFHHIRFERIHPFRDGNGRVGRVLLVGRLAQVLERPFAIDWKSERLEYYAALKAGNKGQLHPLANLCLRSAGLPLISDDIGSPFRVAPRMFEERTSTSIEEDFDWSIRR
jgi:fido (protein-threonine AMPylation protein)